MGRKDKNTDDQQMEVSRFTGMMMTIFFSVLSLAFLFPILLVFMNAFKSKLYISDAPFRLRKKRRSGSRWQKPMWVLETILKA